MEIENGKIVKILYTNYKGETGYRSIVPQRIWFGATEWHPEAQWLLDAYDLDKRATRNFTMKDIGKWTAGKKMAGEL